MNTNEMTKLLNLYKRAESQRKGDYRVYESLKSEVKRMNLRSDEYETAIRKLANTLKV